MHIAVVLTSVHHRRALAAGPIDAEWLLGAMTEHSFELFVDQATEASEALRKVGVPVSVSLKRSLVRSNGRRKSSDALQAQAALRSHKNAAFDAIVYGGDANVDYAWFEPELRCVPRGVVLGAGPAHDLRTVWQDRGLFARLARRTWAQAGLVTSADFLVSDVPTAAFGLCDEQPLPPRLAVGEAVPMPEAEPSPDHRRIVVAATSLGGRDLEDLMRRVVEAWPPTEATTYVVLTRAPVRGGRSSDELLLAGCPESLCRQTVVVPVGDDGVATDFLHTADVVLAASPAELAVPAIADAVRGIQWYLLDDDACLRAEPAGKFPDHLPAEREPRDMHALSWQEPKADMVRNLEKLAREVAADDLLLVHVGGRAGPAVSLLELSNLRGVDLVLWGQAGPVLGLPEPQRLYPYAFAVRGELVPMVVRAMKQAESIWDLICCLGSLEWIDRLRLLMMPAGLEDECWEFREAGFPGVVGSLNRGMLPAPRWLPAPQAPPEPAPQIVPVTMPSRPFVPHAIGRPRISLAGWLRRTRWLDRLRVVLPWKWGLLERAMKDQW